MSDVEPTKPYIYQPDPPPRNGSRNPRIYALAGPGVPDELRGRRFNKDEAKEHLAKLLEDRRD